MARRKTLPVWLRAVNSGWTYSGDIDLEHGGTFWKDVGARDYVEAVRVTPCTDGGGPDNLFCIETGSIYFSSDRPKERNRMLECVSVDPERIGPYTLWEIVEGSLCYGGIDRAAMNGETYVRIGGKQSASRDSWNPEPDVILPANAHLENYMFRQHIV